MLGACIFNGIIYVQKETWDQLGNPKIQGIIYPDNVKIIKFPLSSDYNLEKCISIPVGHVSFRVIDKSMYSKQPSWIKNEYCIKVEYEKDVRKENYHWVTMYLED